MIRKRAYLDEMTTSAAVPDVVGGFSVRRRSSTPTLTGTVDRIYRSVTQIFRTKKKKKKRRR
jgi:hypothetical protein